MKVALLSIEPEDLRGYVYDDDRVVQPLREIGHVADFVPWKRTDLSWREYDGVIIRTTWDYQKNLAAFLNVLRRIESETRLANPFEIVQWNADKKVYLRSLEERGVRIVPTIWNNSKIESHQIQQWFSELQTDEIVIKPSVGANAQDALCLKRSEPDAVNLCQLFDGRSCMIQPFMRGITDEGEFSLFYFNGEYSHAILKTPKMGDFRTQEEHGATIQAIKPPTNLQTAAEEILRHVSPTPLYARVDLVRTEENEFVLMELELIEPSLYLREAEHAPRSFADAINRWLKAG